MIRLATQDDLDFLDQHDRVLTRTTLAYKIERNEVYVVEREGKLIGWARYNLFCDLFPFLTLIYIVEGHRRQGFGSQLMRYWEQEMKAKGHRVLLTSTQANEDAQHFYRRIGYADTGAILFPGQAATELVLCKNLAPPSRT